MLVSVRVIPIHLHRLAITFAADIDPLACADVSHVTGPAAVRLDVQNETVELCMVSTRPRHPEASHKLTTIEFKQVFYAIVADGKIERAAVRAANGGRCEDIPVKELRQVIDLGLDGG